LSDTNKPAAQSAGRSGHGSAASKTERLLRQLSDGEDSGMEELSSTSDSNRPWLKDFNMFLDASVLNARSEKMSLVTWWGVRCVMIAIIVFQTDAVLPQLNAETYGPVWASLARDYLAIMASSVSSERAFSSAGITISKRRNRLKGDIVEALQFMKCFYKQDLLFREQSPWSGVEVAAEEDEVEAELEAEELTAEAPHTPWDSIIDSESEDD
jgi:hypothetical protein